MGAEREGVTKDSALGLTFGSWMNDSRGIGEGCELRKVKISMLFCGN